MDFEPESQLMNPESGQLYEEPLPRSSSSVDTPLFSELGGQIMKYFDVVIAKCGRFFLRYNTHW